MQSPLWCPAKIWPSPVWLATLLSTSPPRKKWYKCLTQIICTQTCKKSVLIYQNTLQERHMILVLQVPCGLSDKTDINIYLEVKQYLLGGGSKQLITNLISNFNCNFKKGANWNHLLGLCLKRGRQHVGEEFQSYWKQKLHEGDNDEHQERQKPEAISTCSEKLRGKLWKNKWITIIIMLNSTHTFIYINTQVRILGTFSTCLS